MIREIVWIRKTLALRVHAEQLELHGGEDNPEVGSKTFNVTAVGIGPICRLDVDGPAHRPAGRSHKHSLQTDRCPDRNLPDGVIDRPDLAGASVTDLFVIFCKLAEISHEGTFHPPGY